MSLFHRRFLAVTSVLCLCISHLPQVQIVHADECEEECENQQEQQEQSLSTSTTTDNTGGTHNGGHRGANTQGIRFTLVSILSGIFDLTPEQRHQIVFGSYSVSTQFSVDTSLLGVPVDPDLQEVICKMMSTLRTHDDFTESRGIIATIIADIFGANENAVHTALGRIGFCTGGYSALKETTKLIAAEEEVEYIFLVDAEGVPISSDPIWNACIRDTILLRPDGKPYRCRRDEYHSGNRWYHPDIPMLEFSWNPRKNPRGIVLPQHVTIIEQNSLIGA